MTDPMRVLQVATKMDRGGLETMVMNYYRHIDRSQIQFDFLLHRSEEGAYDEEIRGLGGRIYYAPRSNPLNPIYLKSLDSFFAKHNDYRVVHSHIDCMSALPLRYAKKYDVPIRIAHSHNSRQDKDLKYPLKLICKRYIPKEATHLFACGKKAGEWMFGGRSFKVIPNAINVDDFKYDKTKRAKVRKELDLPTECLVVGHVGRFQPAKNHLFLINIFAQLAEMLSNARLVLVGDGQLFSETQKIADSLGIMQKVLFLGVRDDVKDLMQAFDLFLMPSLYEGLPLVLVEAQASGLPCVISNSIPDDCDLDSSCITRLPLSISSIEWAKEIMAISQSALSDSKRDAGSRIVQNAGFDIATASKKLEAFYLGVQGTK